MFFGDPIINELVYNGLCGKPSQLAEIIFHFYKHDFVYAENNEWYTFDNIWIKLGPQNTTLKSIVQKKLSILYKQLYEFYKIYDNNKKKLLAIKQIIVSFGKHDLQNNIITELIDLFAENNNPQRNFIKKLDTNNKLIGFNNGVFDLVNFKFRIGKPDDFLSISVGYDYCDTKSNKYNELLQFLDDILPNENERNHLISYISLGLVGNILELFTVFTGSGKNGKSTFVKLIQHTFGNYWGAVQNTFLTKKRLNPHLLNTQILNLSSKRIVTSFESEKKEQLIVGNIYFLTNNNTSTLRKCHSNNMIEFKPNFITIFVCNNMPIYNYIDDKFNRKLKYIVFPTKFVDNPTNELQKKINIHIDENFYMWKSDFMLLLIECYKKYKLTNQL